MEKTVRRERDLIMRRSVYGDGELELGSLGLAMKVHSWDQLGVIVWW